mgnify:FL=1
MSTSVFLNELRRKDIRVWAEGDRLRCSAPDGVLSAELSETIRQRKEEILAFLRIADTVAQQHPAIVPLRAKGNLTPVYAVSGHNGDVFAYVDLVRHLGERQPFFGLHPPGLDGHSKPLTRVEDLAAYFASQIRSFHSSGPAIIAGYCAGGAIAFELARQLEKSGMQIRFLALFGCPYPANYRFIARLPYWMGRILLHLRTVMKLTSMREASGYLKQRLARRIETARTEGRPMSEDVDSVMKFQLEQATIKAVRRYVPSRFPGRLIQILPVRGWMKSNMGATRWRSVVMNAEEVFGPDTCNPATMLLDPDAPEMAALFSRYRDLDARQER